MTNRELFLSLLLFVESMLIAVVGSSVIGFDLNTVQINITLLGALFGFLSLTAWGNAASDGSKVQLINLANENPEVLNMVNEILNKKHLQERHCKSAVNRIEAKLLREKNNRIIGDYNAKSALK